MAIRAISLRTDSSPINYYWDTITNTISTALSPWENKPFDSSDKEKWYSRFLLRE